MPRTNIQPRHRRRDEYFSAEWSAFLLSPCNRLDALVCGLPELFHDDAGRLAALRDAWDCRRDDLLPDWIISHPGTRPCVWWLVDASEPRRKIGGGGHPERRDGANIFASAPPGCTRMWLRYREPEPIYETELAYLVRLGLLTEGEV